MNWIIHWLYLAVVELRRANKTLELIADALGPPPRIVDSVAWHHEAPKREA